MFWVLVTLSLVCADKLDRTYLPPPTAEYSGGRAEDIQAPLEYPTRNDYMGHMEIAIGIDRVGPKQVLDAQKYSENTFPTIENVITQTKPNNSYEAYLTNSIGSDYTPNYSYGESPIVQNTHIEQDQNQNIYRLPANLIIENNNYPLQFQTGNIFADIKSSLPTTIQPQRDGDSVIYIPCNRSSLIDFINNTCIDNNNANQYLSTFSPTTNYISTTLSPSSVTPKHSDNLNLSKSPNYINTASTIYSPTSKNPFNKNSLNYDVTAKRPERIQAQVDREAVILNYENLLTPESYAYSFDTSNGIHGDESGIAVNGVKAKGSYSYIGDDGKRYSVVYTADENGFQPQGDHLPTPPSIPDAILKVIEKAFEDKKAGIFDDGSYDENKYGYKKYQKNPYEKSFFNRMTGQEKKIDSLSLRNNIPFEPIQETGKSESSRKISGSDYSKNISELNQDYNQEVVQDDINYKHIKEMKDVPEKIEEQFFQNLPIQSNNTTYDKTNSSPITKLPFFTEMDHKYFLKQNEEAKEFPSRFSETQGIRNENMQQVNVTPKPFMTPYVSRISNEDDEVETSDSKEKTYEKPGQSFNDGYQQNHNRAEYPVEDGLRKKVDFSDISDNNDSFKLTNNGYFYPKEMNSEKTLFSQYANPYLPTSSNGPLKFTSQSTIMNIDQYYSDMPQSTSTPTSAAIKEKGSENLTPTSFPNYSTTKLDFVNEYGNTHAPTVNNFNDAYGINKENMINRSKSVSTSRPVEDIPQFKASYSPNIDLIISNYNTIPSTTNRNIEEDFSGPKRPQTFDSLTGYHY